MANLRLHSFRLGIVVILATLARTGDIYAANSTTAPANQWLKLDKADLKRPDVPLIFEPTLGRFMVLGGNIDWTTYPKPHPFDEVALDEENGQWENWIPQGKD